MLITRLKRIVSVYQTKKKWREMNPHNETAFGEGNPSGVSVGNYTYGAIHVPYYGNRLSIGHFCSIADEVVFLTSGEHSYHSLTTFPYRAKLLHQPEQYTSKGEIVVEDDVWIGYGATILSGVTIGQGAIIGAGSVVAKDVPPYAVFAGNRIVKFRFSQDIIEKLMRFDFSKLTKEDIEKHHDLLDQEIDESFFRTSFYLEHLKQ